MISPEILRRYPYFADVQEDSLREVAMISEEVTIPAETIMYREGDVADNLFVLVEGEVDIQFTLGSGELRTVDTIVGGELIMWSALVEPYKSTAVVVTRQDAKVIEINAEKLRGLCSKDPQLTQVLLWNLTKLLATRLEGARVQLATVD